MPHDSLKHKVYGALSPTHILLATKIQDSFAQAPTSQDALCSQWIQFSMSLPSGHAVPLYRLHKGSPSINMTKSPTLTLSLQSTSQCNPSCTRSLDLLELLYTATRIPLGLGVLLLRNPTAVGILIAHCLWG